MLNTLIHNLHKAVYLSDKLAAHILNQKFTLGFAQFRILLAVHKYPNLSQSKLASFHGLTRAAINRQIKLLTKQGFLITVKMPGNKKEFTLNLTQKGKKVLEKCLKELNKVYDKINKKLTIKEEKLTNVTLEKIIFELRLLNQPIS